MENPVTELLRCPFCDGRAIGNLSADKPYIYCEKCDVHAPGYDTIEEAIAAWNRRVMPSAEKFAEWSTNNSFRLSQVQGFGYGPDGYLYTARDCWLKENQVFWQRQSSEETEFEDHNELVRQLEQYKIQLILDGVMKNE